MAISDLSAGDSGSPTSYCAPTTPSVRHTSDRRWKKLTAQANAAYAQGDIPLALATYTDALTEANHLFDTAIADNDAIPVPVIFNISCHNLAELFEKSEEMAKAESYYQMAYDRLLTAARCPSGMLEGRISCTQHLKHALAMFVQHLHRQGGCDERIGDIISRAHHVAYSVYQVAQHATQANDYCSHCSIALS